MSRLAAIDIPSLPLQVLHRDHPEWHAYPTAVVARDEPQALVTHASRSAQALGIRVGMRYAAALSLSRELRAAPVPRVRIDALCAELVGVLHRWTPRVDAEHAHEGVLWLDPRGMLSLYGSLERWTLQVAEALALHLWKGAVVVGFAKWPLWVVARSLSQEGASHAILQSPEEERARAAKVPLGWLDFSVTGRDNTFADGLFLLGVKTLGDLLRIPRSEIGVRFGRDAARLHAELSGEAVLPFEAAPQQEIFEVEAEVDPPASDETRLLHCAQGALHVLLATLAQKRLALAALHLSLHAERGVGLVPGKVHKEVLRPSRASRDMAAVVELMRLRLAACAADGRLEARIERLVLVAEPAAAEGTQLGLLSEGRGDPEALARGIARLRAAFGIDAVTRPRLEDSWVPEKTFSWEPVSRLPTHSKRPEAQQPAAPGIMRRVFHPPQPMELDSHRKPRIDPPVRHLWGPHRLQARWWLSGTSNSADAPTVRDYFYVEREDGVVLWLFRDITQDRWFLQGVMD